MLLMLVLVIDHNRQRDFYWCKKAVGAADVGHVMTIVKLETDIVL